MMEFILHSLAQNWLGASIGLIGVILGVHFYRASRIGARLAYQASGLRLIGGKKPQLPSQVTVLFSDQPVDMLTRTLVVLWNSGAKTIRGEDVVDDDRLRIAFDEGARILKASVTDMTRQANKFRIDKSTTSPHEALCSFDYLDSGDGVVVELLHTSAHRYPKVEGTVRGIPRGVTDYGSLFRALPPLPILPGFRFAVMNPRVFLRVMLIFGLALTILGLATLPSTADRAASWALFATGAMYALLGGFMLWLRRRRFPRALSVESIQPY